MAWATKDWASRISDVLNTPEYHNATITLLDPAIAPVGWDIESNLPIPGETQVIASGIHARINWPLRSTADSGTADYDSTTIRSGRCQINNVEYSGPLRTGMQIRVTNGGRSSDLTRYIFTVSEALNSSWMVSRTFKISSDGQAVNAWDEAPEPPVYLGYGQGGYGNGYYGGAFHPSTQFGAGGYGQDSYGS